MTACALTLIAPSFSVLKMKLPDDTGLIKKVVSKILLFKHFCCRLIFIDYEPAS